VLTSFTDKVFVAFRVIPFVTNATYGPKSLGLATGTPLTLTEADEM
jgi:hypothetical protein